MGVDADRHFLFSIHIHAASIISAARRLGCDYLSRSPGLQIQIDPRTSRLGAYRVHPHCALGSGKSGTNLDLRGHLLVLTATPPFQNRTTSRRRGRPHRRRACSAVYVPGSNVIWSCADRSCVGDGSGPFPRSPIGCGIPSLRPRRWTSLPRLKKAIAGLIDFWFLDQSGFAPTLPTGLHLGAAGPAPGGAL